MGDVISLRPQILRNKIVISDVSGEAYGKAFQVVLDEPAKRIPPSNGFEIDMRGFRWLGDFPSWAAAMGLASSAAEFYDADIDDQTGLAPPSPRGAA